MAMNRQQWLTGVITKQQRGIEIGPYTSPLVPKRSGYNVVIIDVLDAAELRKRAAADAWIAQNTLDQIEEVDLVGSCTSIAELVEAKYGLASFDYIISSHNLEHLPDPIRFLQACQKVLRPGGIISLAVPDRRVCFDYFRPHNTLADWLEAYFAKRERPTTAQVFRQFSLHSHYMDNGKQLGTFELDRDPAPVEPLQMLAEAFSSYKAQEASPDQVYNDVHCWAFTPSSLELMLRELNFLGLIQLELQEVTATYGSEFFLRLRNSDNPAPLSAEEFYPRRHELLRQGRHQVRWLDGADL
jgi:predicted SAM-dependent methyltransferase